MATRMASSTSKSSKSRTIDADLNKSTTTSKRSSLIPTPTTKSPSYSSTSRSVSRKPTQTTRSSSTTRQLPVTNRTTSKPVERSFPLYNGPTGSEQGSNTATTANIDTLPPQPRLRHKQSSRNQRSHFTSSNVAMPTPPSTEENHPSEILDNGRSLGEGLSPSTSYNTFPNIPAVASAGSVPLSTASRLQSFVTHGPQPPQPLKTPDLKPPEPGFLRNQTPSTAVSESPGPFSHYSRESTPTSVFSISPGIIQVPKFASRNLASPTRTTPTAARSNQVGNAAKTKVRSQSTSHSNEERPVQIKRAPSSKHADIGSEVLSGSRKNVLRKPPPNPPQRVSSKSALSTDSIDAKLEQAPKDLPSAGVASVRSTSTNRSKASPKLVTIPPSKSKIPPPRPSRDGAADLVGFGRSPIMQSNIALSPLTKDSTAEALQSPLMKTVSTDNHDAKTRSTQEVSTSSIRSKQNPSRVPPSRPSITSPHLTSREASRVREPIVGRKSIDSRTSSRDPSPAMSSSSKTFLPFGLFSRKPKSSAEVESSNANEKAGRKGPAAGTGHEGYSKYARRGRSGSTSTAASRGRSTSTESNTFGGLRVSSSRKSSFNSNDGRPELDDFLKDRLEPVIIGGGGLIKENRNSNAASSINTSIQGSTMSLDSVDQHRTAYGKHAKGYESSISVSESINSNTSIAYSASLTESIRPSLAHRRSLLRSNVSGKESGIKVPSPIKTNRGITSPGPATYDSTLSTALTDASGPPTDLSEGNEGSWLRPKKKRTLLQSKRPRKWNIFHRRQKSIDSIQEPSLSRQTSNEQRDLGISGLDDNLPVAHYALSDDFESDQAENIEITLRNIERDLDLEPEEYTSGVEAVQNRQPSMLLPSPPKFPSQFDTLTTRGVDRQGPQNLTNIALNRQPRLQQIGRIPQVGLRSERVHRPSPQSFSRPFARGHEAENSTDADILSQFPNAGGRPKLGLQTEALSGMPLPLFSANLASAPPTNGMLYNLDGEREFLHFSPRKWSEVSTANSSGTMSLAAITALVSPPDAVLSDDEVWGEFDDFLDQVTSPVSASPRTPGLKARTDYFDSTQKNVKSTSQDSPSDSVTTIETSGSYTEENADSGLPIKTDRLIPPEFQNQLNSPLSLTDLYNNYGSGGSITKSATRDSTFSTTSSHYSSQTPVSRSGSRSSITSGHTKRVTQYMAQKTRRTSTDSLRFSALMTSRWLTFDRVLFSPIQDQMRSTRQDRILVVDGLGNDDWSTYCALTFPEASVHSLTSLGSKTNREKRNSDNWSPPSNHRRHTHTDVNAPFPFVKHWFSAVVLRFPAANTSLAYRHAISECERVLRPGGYLELSVLDMDMVNMGSRISHAVRSLKMHMHEARPDISLSPVSDEILKLLGKKGFENVSRAIVGVPVVGSDTGSPVKTQPQHTAESAHLSLGDLLADQAKNQQLHYPSTKAMAKAGRWWWSKCYESLSGSEEGSIWDDEQVLRECEIRETGLKLFVCYAQKPIGLPRRTVSV